MKFVIIMCRVLRGVTSDMTVPCYLTVYYPNYSEITGNSHLFLKNTKWLPNTSQRFTSRSNSQSQNSHSRSRDRHALTTAKVSPGTAHEHTDSLAIR